MGLFIFSFETRFYPFTFLPPLSTVTRFLTSKNSLYLLPLFLIHRIRLKTKEGFFKFQIKIKRSHSRKRIDFDGNSNPLFPVPVAPTGVSKKKSIFKLQIYCFQTDFRWYPRRETFLSWVSTNFNFSSISCIPYNL